MPKVYSCRYHENCDGHALSGFEPTITKQAFKEECDINNIVERARNGQDISGSLNARVAKYGDFTNIPDFRGALDLVQRAESMFMELEAPLRERFANDPAVMLDFLNNPANRDEAVKLGLLTPKKADSVVSNPPAGAPAGVPPAGTPDGGGK